MVASADGAAWWKIMICKDYSLPSTDASMNHGKYSGRYSVVEGILDAFQKEGAHEASMESHGSYRGSFGGYRSERGFHQ